MLDYNWNWKIRNNSVVGFKFYIKFGSVIMENMLPDMTKIFEEQLALYLDKGVIHKVLVSHIIDTEDKLILTLIPLGEFCGRENDDDEWEYNTVRQFKEPFNFGGVRVGISLNKGILAVPFCGSLNLNEFAVQHFDRREPDFHLLWYNVAPDED
jgi:hypothetical protein